MRAVGRLLGLTLALGAGLLGMPAQAEVELFHQDNSKLVFNADLVVAGFANKNAWFGQSKPFLGADTDSWLELGVEPQLTMETPLAGGTLFGALSAIYTRTFDDDASGLTIGLEHPDDLDIEQGHLGWKKQDVFSALTDDEFSISLGRQDYSIGSGLLIADGGGDGGDRGGWYLGLRKAFKNSVIARVASKQLLAEAFYVENQPRSGGTEGDATGANLEWHFGEALTLGGTYLLVDANLPDTDKLDVYSGRASWNAINHLTLSGELVHQNNDQIRADGWFAEAAYLVDDLPWKPRLSYRYAHFEGDDPDSSRNESFRSIAYGATDYGSWYQGEISGNYPLGNSNLDSHLIRVKAQPSETLTLNLMYYNFRLDEPAALAPGVTSDDWGDEVNFTADWQATEKIYVIGVLAALFPGKAAEQWVGSDDTWLYSMLYTSYAF